MKGLQVIALGLLLVLSMLLATGSGPTAVSAKVPKILEFDTMVGVPAGLTGAQSQGSLRGINGGGLPWAIGSAHGELTASGRLEITVQGLVLAAGANAGSNPIASFRAMVSCVRSDGSFENIPTDTFPATTGPATSGGGNASIETNVSLPSPCIAPIIFVTNAGGSWFAATGK
jgi:hypothetical protein